VQAVWDTERLLPAWGAPVGRAWDGPSGAS
jgi:hypothetical protein